MNLRRMIALLLITVVMLSSCTRAETPLAPDEMVIQNDIADYITEILDDTAFIVAFERINDSCSSSRAMIDCEVTYQGDKGEYTGIFTLEYHLNKEAWTLEKCSLVLTEHPGNTSEEPIPTDTSAPSTAPTEAPPTESTPTKTEPVQTEPKHHWKISHSKKTLRIGDSFRLRVTDQADTAANVVWRSNKSGIVSISGNKITALAEGEVKVTCSVDGQDFSCVIVVKAKSTNTTPSTEPSTAPPTTQPTDPPKAPPTDPPTPPTEPSCVLPPAPPPTTLPPETPTETDPPETQGKAPSGYSIYLNPKEVYVLQTFYVTVNPDVADYTKIVVHAIDPNGGTWDFVITNGNSNDLVVTQFDLTGTWTIYADVYNDYGVFYGASSGAKAYLKVHPLPI